MKSIARRAATSLALLVTLQLPAVAGTADLAAKSAEAADIVRRAREDAIARVIVRFAEPARAPAQPAAVANGADAILRDVFGLAPAAAGRRSASPMRHAPLFAFKGTLADVEALAADPRVTAIYPDRVSAPSLDKSVAGIGALDFPVSGLTGAGSIVAVIDTGMRKTHAFLAGSVLTEACYSMTTEGDTDPASTCPGLVTESVKVGSASNCTIAERCNHATHVAGIITGARPAGAGTSVPARGVAPAAGIIAIQATHVTKDGLRFYDSDLLKALERVYDLRIAFPGKRIVAVNMSLGGGAFIRDCTAKSPLSDIIWKLRVAGIATIVAAGNDGFSESVASPGCIAAAVTVGASDDDDVIAGFSNRGALVDLFAPGVAIRSSVAGTSTAYASYDGTSMAAPHVAGAVALLRQKFPLANVADIEASLEGSGPGLRDPWTTIEKPATRVDVAAKGVTAPMLLTRNDTPMIFQGLTTTGPFVDVTGTTRTLETSNGTLFYEITSSAPWLVVPSGVRLGSVTTLAKPFTLKFDPLAALKAGPGFHPAEVRIRGQASAVRDSLWAKLDVPLIGVPNDAFSKAIEMKAYRIAGSNVGATLQAGEKDAQVIAGKTVRFGRTVWFRKSWPIGGAHEVHTVGSSIDTVLCVYRGGTLSSLARVGCNDWFIDGHFGPSRVAFMAASGVTYWFQVGSFRSGASDPGKAGGYAITVD